MSALTLSNFRRGLSGLRLNDLGIPAVILDNRIADRARSVALARIVSNVGFRSPGELLMTLSTSLVAVCCSSDSVRSSVRWRSSLR